MGVPSFPPPEEFVKHAKVTDPAIYDRAAADAPAWWAEQARTRLDWQTPFSQVLDDSNAPFCTWFADGTLNASYNCLDRHVNAGLGDRVAFRWHGEEGEERSLTYTGLLADVQRLANARTLFNDPDRYVQTYFSRFGPRTYLVGDGARRDEDGYFWITGRVDDVINVSGHRLSTAEIESALVAHAAVAEAAVIAVTDEMSGQAVIAYVTVVGEAEPGPDLATELRDYVGTRIGKLARPRRIIWSPELPKTRSGKIMRRLLRDIAEGRDLGDVTTLADPSVVSALQEAAGEGSKP